MARKADLTFAFQPLIHEPLSARQDNNEAVSSTVPVNGSDMCGGNSSAGKDGLSPSIPNGDSVSSPNSQEGGKKVAMSLIDVASQCRVEHPRKAMSLFLKASKDLILASEEDLALHCLESLIQLASDQLSLVQEEKEKLPPIDVPVVTRKSSRNQMMHRSISEYSRNSSASDVGLNGRSPSCSISSLEGHEQLDKEHKAAGNSLTKQNSTCSSASSGSLTQQELVAVEEVDGEAQWTDVHCQTDFEIVRLNSVDSASVYSNDVKVHTCEVVMECGESVVEEVSTSPSQKALIRRRYVMSELIDTEQSYIQDMAFIVKGYIPKLSSETTPLELKDREKDVFGNIDDIYEWHSGFFFKYMKDSEDQPNKIGELFLTSESRLEMLYTEYCRNKPVSDDLVQTHAETFFKECKKDLGHRLDLSDYLIKPVQRITKYQLLLKDIVRHTQKAGEDATDIQKALEVVVRILKRTNDMVNVAMLQGFDIESEETGELIFQDAFDVADGKAKSKPKERRVFLFEKLLLFTEPVVREGGLPAYKYVNSVKTKGLGQTESVGSEPCRWAVWQRRLGGADIFVLTASNADVKEAWIRTIKLCQEKKKRGFLKGLRYKVRRESCLDQMDGENLSVPANDTRRTTVKHSTSRTTKKRGRGSEAASRSERLQESIRRFAEEERQIHLEQKASARQLVDHVLDESSVPASPNPASGNAQSKTDDPKMAPAEHRAMLESQEIQLHKLLLLTRMIAARLFQDKDGARALLLYNDVISTMLPVEELKKLEPMHTARDAVLQVSADVYEAWRRRQPDTGPDIQESHNSLVSLLNETAGYCSRSKASPWSVVLYLLAAAASCREQHWQDASQAFYRASQVYNALQASKCAVDSLLDAHFMCCEAGDYSAALQFLYNALVRTLACRDVFRCLRLEQQATFLVDKINSLNSKTPNGGAPTGEEWGEPQSQQVSVKHLDFLVNMSRANRRRDWAWFEISASELQGMSERGGSNQAEAILLAVFLKLKKSLERSLEGE